LRITVGSKALADGKVEFVRRSTGQVELIEVEKICTLIKEIVQEALDLI
jgi:prolyl-tRNA synthetase